MAHHETPASHFNKKTLKALTALGIRLIGTQAIPDEKGSYLNSSTGYCLDDNGTHRILGYLEVLGLVA